MSHEVETMAYANARPWHGLGLKVDSFVSTEEMLKAAGLDWKVKMHPMFAQYKDEQTGKITNIKVEDRYALIRDSDQKIMTVASEAWTPVQNEEIFSFMKQYVETGGATLETAGSLRGGNIVWSLANLNHDFEVRPGDRVKGYLLMTTSHVVGRATSCGTTQIRVVCANTMRAAENDQQIHYRQNHLKEFDFSKAKEQVEMAHEELRSAEKVAHQLNDLKLSMLDAVDKVYGPALFPKEHKEGLIMPNIDLPDELPKSLNEILECYSGAPGALPGTGWGALNAVTFWADHMAGREQSVRIFNSWFGPNAKAKAKVQEKLLELV